MEQNTPLQSIIDQYSILYNWHKKYGKARIKKILGNQEDFEEYLTRYLAVLESMPNPQEATLQSALSAVDEQIEGAMAWSYDETADDGTPLREIARNIKDEIEAFEKEPKEAARQSSTPKAKEKTFRLSQVARKLNVGTATIVKVLASKGFKIKNLPNSKITQDQFDMLEAEFSSSSEEVPGGIEERFKKLGQFRGIEDGIERELSKGDVGPKEPDSGDSVEDMASSPAEVFLRQLRHALSNSENDESLIAKGYQLQGLIGYVDSEQSSDNLELKSYYLSADNEQDFLYSTPKHLDTENFRSRQVQEMDSLGYVLPSESENTIRLRRFFRNSEGGNAFDHFYCTNPDFDLMSTAGYKEEWPKTKQRVYIRTKSAPDTFPLYVYSTSPGTKLFEPLMPDEDGGSTDKSEAVRLYLDNPASKDELDRGILADALYEHITKIWAIKQDEGQAFTLHIHGEWGVGKTSVLKLLEKKLQDEPQKNDKWVVAWFNAWQHQHIDPPWWSLMDTLYKSMVVQLRSWKIIGAPGRALAIWAHEQWFRIFARASPTLMTLGILVLVLSSVWLFRSQLYGMLPGPIASPATSESLLADSIGDVFIMERIAEDNQTKDSISEGSTVVYHVSKQPDKKPEPEKLNLSALIKDVGAAFALIGTLVGFFYSLSKSLLPGSGEAAREFMRGSRDPMERIKKHFKSLIKQAQNPAAVFIDDLDRCKEAYCVQLLEGMQTLFKDSNVLFVVAADRRWMSTCFENVYKNFQATVHKPGNRLGYLFVEKAFQMSVSVPAISPETQEAYWRNLLEVKVKATEGGKTPDEQAKEIENLFENKESEASVLDTLEEVRKDKGLRQDLAVKAAVKKIGSAKVKEETEHALQDFATLLEPNPRAMKRLINFYSIFRQQKIVEGLTTELSLSHIARWLIFSTRFPVWAEYLEDDPGDVNYLLGKKKLTKMESESKPEDFKQMVASSEARKILEGDPKDPITPEIVGYCIGEKA